MKKLHIIALALASLIFSGTLGVAQTSGTTSTPAFNMAQTLSDGAQRSTLGFDGLGMMTGNLDAQSFFPPGKVADYTGFQYLRDNDPDNMGHNTSFLTRVAYNVLYILNDSQLAQLKALAATQTTQINLYGYKRFALMQAFRRLLSGDLPVNTTGLSLTAVKQASHELYLLDGQIAFDRALLYANIYSSMTSTQKAYLDAMKGKGWSSWPSITDDQVKSKTQGLSPDAAVAVMTYAGDLFSWYAGSVTADVYFCPERHGTYYGGFYIKDAPAVGQPGYSISEQLTATAGAAICDSSKGYVTASQATQISSLVDLQRNNLYAGMTNIVSVRTQIATLLRSLLVSTASSDSVNAQVLALSGTYGDLDGENNYNYATVFAQVYKSLTDTQKTQLTTLRKTILSGTYSSGTTFDFSVCTTPFLYSAPITDVSFLSPYIANTDYLFSAAIAPVTSFQFLPAAPLVGQTVTFSDSSTNAPTAWLWSFGDGSISTTKNPTHVYSVPGNFTASLTTSNAGGSSASTQSVTVSASTSQVGMIKQTVSLAVSSGANPIIADNDTVAYKSGSSGVNAGIWGQTGSATPRLVAQTNGTALLSAGTANGVFTGMGDPVLNSQGQVAFMATARVGTASVTGIWSDISGALKPAVSVGDSVPVIGGTATLAAVGPFALTDTGILIFSGTLNIKAGLVTANNSAGIWSINSGGKLRQVLRNGTAWSLNNTTVTLKSFSAFATPAVVGGQTRSFNSTGDVVVWATFTNGAQGIFAFMSGTGEIIALQGDAITGIPGALFSTFGSPAINNAQQVAFWASVSGNSTITTQNNTGIWLDSGTACQCVARTSGKASVGGTATGIFTTLGNPVINNKGQVAFPGTLQSGGAVADGGTTGIWIATSGTVTLVARTQTQAPDCPTGTLFANFRQFVLSDRGVVLLADLVGTKGVTAANNQGIWAVDAKGQLHLIARKGDPQPGNSSKISTGIGLFNSTSDTPGQTRSVNHQGDITYTATYGDNTTAIYRVVFPGAQ